MCVGGWGVIRHRTLNPPLIAVVMSRPTQNLHSTESPTDFHIIGTAVIHKIYRVLVYLHCPERASSWKPVPIYCQAAIHGLHSGKHVKIHQTRHRLIPSLPG